MTKLHKTDVLTQAEFLRYQMNTSKTPVKAQLPPGGKWLVMLTPVPPDTDIGEDDAMTADLRKILDDVQVILPKSEILAKGQVEPALLFDGDATMGMVIHVRDDTPDPSKVPAPA